jgi:uncharacterized membrane protein
VSRSEAPARDVPRTIGCWVVAAAFTFTGIGHFRSAEAFEAQVPPWMPWPEAVVAVSGVVELAFAVALIALPRYRVQVGWAIAAFLVIIFPGNISQFVTGTAAFGLDSDLARGVRLLFQPLMIAFVLWSTGAWRARRTGEPLDTSHHEA